MHFIIPSTPGQRPAHTRSMRFITAIAASLMLGAALAAFAGCASSLRNHTSAATVAPTAITEGPLASVVAPAAAPLARRISTSYDRSTQQASITVTIAAAPDVSAGQARVMTLCFAVQKAVWTNNPSLREVKVIVLGPIHDDYGDIIDAPYGTSDVLAPTAAKIPWNTLTPESAWSRYDNTWMRVAYKSNWIYGKNN
ncbi:MAG: hypothetical protein ACM3N4_05230 [Nitrososphaerota archaeon]